MGRAVRDRRWREGSNGKLQRPLYIALFLGMALRAAWIGALASTPVFDAKTYFEIATQLASHFQYAYAGQASAYWPIGYPATLAALFLVFGAKLTTAWLLNLIAGAGALLCLHHIALGLGLPRRVADCATFLAALDPVAISYSSLAVTETYFAFLMLLAAACSVGPKVTPRRLLAGGVACGLAALTRPQALILPLLVGLAGADFRLVPISARRRVTLLGIGLVLVMAPWWIRNAIELKTFVPVSTNGGVNFYIGNNPHAIGRYRFDQLVTAPLDRSFRDGYMGGQHEIEYDRFCTSLALEYISADPWSTLGMWPLKVGYTYLPDITALGWNSEPVTPFRASVLRATAIPIALHHVALLALALVGFARLVRMSRARASGLATEETPRWSVRSPLVALPLAIIIAFTGVSLLYFGMPRYHFPMLPWLELYAAVALALPKSKAPLAHQSA